MKSSTLPETVNSPKTTLQDVRARVSQRIFIGKNGHYEHQALEEKKSGSTPGGKTKTLRTNQVKHPGEFIFFIQKLTFGIESQIMHLDPTVIEKIASDIYKGFALAATTRLNIAHKKIVKKMLHTFTEKDKNTEELLIRNIRTFDKIKSSSILNQLREGSLLRQNRVKLSDYYLLFSSKIVSDYQDLGSCWIEDLSPTLSNYREVINDTISSEEVEILKKKMAEFEEENTFISVVKNTRTLPETIYTFGHLYPLNGLLKIAAIAKILGDIDWLGGSGTNTGVILREEGELNVIIVDASYALMTDEQILNKTLKDKNIKFGAQVSETIVFKFLTPNQQYEFISTLDNIINNPELDQILDYLIFRDGAFNKTEQNILVSRPLVTKEATAQLIKKIKYNLTQLEIVYAEELSAYRTGKFNHLAKNSILKNEFDSSLRFFPEAKDSNQINKMQQESDSANEICLENKKPTCST